VHSLPSGALRGALASVLSVVCLRGLPHDPLGLSLVVRCNPASCSLRAIASPSPGGLVSSPASPTVLYLYIITIIIINLTLIKPEAMQVSYLGLKLRKTLLRTFVQSRMKNLKLLVSSLVFCLLAVCNY
jgi:hypothetical protein